MDGGVVQMRKPVRRNLDRDAKLKKSEAGASRRVANEMVI